MTRSRVLIADDDAFSRRLVVNKLGQLGADIVEAADGVQAFKMLEESEVDLVILDLEMPRLDGYELLGCIRGIERLKHLPVVVLTGKEDRTALERALTAGATSFLIKPLNWTAFGGHIGHLLSIARIMRSGVVATAAVPPAPPRQICLLARNSWTTRARTARTPPRMPPWPDRLRRRTATSAGRPRSACASSATA